MRVVVCFWVVHAGQEWREMCGLFYERAWYQHLSLHFVGCCSFASCHDEPAGGANMTTAMAMAVSTMAPSTINRGTWDWLLVTGPMQRIPSMVS